MHNWRDTHGTDSRRVAGGSIQNINEDTNNAETRIETTSSVEKFNETATSQEHENINTHATQNLAVGETNDAQQSDTLRNAAQYVKMPINFKELVVRECLCALSWTLLIATIIVYIVLLHILPGDSQLDSTPVNTSFINENVTKNHDPFEIFDQVQTLTSSSFTPQSTYASSISTATTQVGFVQADAMVIVPSRYRQKRDYSIQTKALNNRHKVFHRRHHYSNIMIRDINSSNNTSENVSSPTNGTSANSDQQSGQQFPFVFLMLPLMIVLEAIAALGTTRRLYITARLYWLQKYREKMAISVPPRRNQLLQRHLDELATSLEQSHQSQAFENPPPYDPNSRPYKPRVITRIIEKYILLLPPQMFERPDPATTNQDPIMSLFTSSSSTQSSAPLTRPPMRTRNNPRNNAPRSSIDVAVSYANRFGVAPLYGSEEMHSTRIVMKSDLPNLPETDVQQHESEIDISTLPLYYTMMKHTANSNTPDVSSNDIHLQSAASLPRDIDISQDHDEEFLPALFAQPPKHEFKPDIEVDPYCNTTPAHGNKDSFNRESTVSFLSLAEMAANYVSKYDTSDDSSLNEYRKK